MHTASFFLPLAAAAGLALADAASLYPGAAPGKAVSSLSETTATLGNDSFSATYTRKGASVTFSGLKAADGTPLVEGGSALFTIYLEDGRVLDSTNMKLDRLVAPAFKAVPSRPQGSARERGRQLHGRFHAPDGSLTVDWVATLANGSHYLRQQVSLWANKEPVKVKQVVALDVHTAPGTGTPTLSGNTTHGCVVVNDRLFFGLETPMSIMSAGNKATHATTTWTPEAWTRDSFGEAFNMPASFEKAYGQQYAATNGPVLTHLKQAEGAVRFAQGGECCLTFQYTAGNHKLNMVGVQLLDKDGTLLDEDVHEGSTGHQSTGNTYCMTVPKAGEYRLRYWVQTRTESIASQGKVVFSLPLAEEGATTTAASQNKVLGVWQRKAPLPTGRRNAWRVTSVMGLLAPGQARRSFLAYVERERAVPYRPFVHYNDWYEIGIRVHDFQDPKKRTNEAMWLEVLDVWHKELFTKRHTRLDGFIIDDGWDDFNSLWGFHCGFPNGFSKLAKEAARQGAGLGTWLGPVGGYGASKRMRLAYWNREHPHNKIDNFQLSNPIYFDAFVARCRQMIQDYGMRYFKFDGISTKYHAKGPANIEDAEGILRVIAALRQAKPNVFINATVGTWASPFWYMHADSVWRQEDDFKQIGNAGDARDRWITYRDRLVHEVFVQGAPLCPINSLMTHGTIITQNGPPRVMSRDPENCRKEMRMAFGCGSALQEIYADHDLLSQQGGLLWDELASCIAWVRRNTDVLPDTHWVGGNPWDGKDGSIYGYAAWNRQKATLTLRNSSASPKTLTTTLRKVLDVPPGIKGTVTFRNSFEDQRLLPGLTGKAVDVDTPLTITMEPLEVMVLEGTCHM